MTIWICFGLAVLVLAAALWIRRKRQEGVYRKELPRVYELHDLITTPRPPEAYFRDFDQSLADYPQKRKHFRDIESDLQELDAAAWAFLKADVASLLTAKDTKRGWQ